MLVLGCALLAPCTLGLPHCMRWYNYSIERELLSSAFLRRHFWCTDSRTIQCCPSAYDTRSFSLPCLSLYVYVYHGGKEQKLVCVVQVKFCGYVFFQNMLVGALSG